MNHLALDCATNTGVAFYLDGEITTANWCLGSARPMTLDKAVRLREFLDRLPVRFEHLTIEVPFGQGKNKFLFDSLLFAALFWAQSRGMSFRGLAPASWKLQALGHGRTPKEEYMQRAIARWGAVLADTEDTAAALWLLECHRMHVESRPF